MQCRGCALFPLALDATYATGTELSGVGVYSRQLIAALAQQTGFRLYYRLHKLRRALPEHARGLLTESWTFPRHQGVFHGLNQRMPAIRFKPGSVCTFHDLFVLTADYSSPEFRQRFALQARDASARADLLICVSEFTASQVHQLLNVPRERLRVIHHGVRSLPRVPAAPREHMVLTTGAIQHRKNTARLIKAFEALDGRWKLVLAGSPAGYGAQTALDALAASPARNRIQVTGYVSDTELAQLYARASIFAFPSLDEGFGMPALEAMSAGIPVIASRRSALPEVCGDAALYIDPVETESLAAALQQLAADDSLRHKLRARGESHAARFTWARAAERTISCYSELR